MNTFETFRAANQLATRHYQAVKRSPYIIERCQREAARLRAECARVEADKNLGGSLIMWRVAADMLDLQADILRHA